VDFIIPYHSNRPNLLWDGNGISFPRAKLTEAYSCDHQFRRLFLMWVF